MRLSANLMRMLKASRQCCPWLAFYLVGYLHLNGISLAIAGAILVLMLVLSQRGSDRPRESRNVVTSEELPSWVLDPDTQRAEWVNAILRQLWPHIEQYLRKALSEIESDPELIHRLSSYHVRSLRFPTVDLGRIPPKLSGIRCHKAVRRDETVLDLSVQYHGDMHIQVEASLDFLPAGWPPVTAAIKNLSFDGCLRYKNALLW